MTRSRRPDSALVIGHWGMVILGSLVIGAWSFSSSVFAGPFDRVGEFALATASPDLREVTDYDISPLGNSVLYYGPLKNGGVGVWYVGKAGHLTPNPHDPLLCDEVYEYGFTEKGKPWLVYRIRDTQYVAFDGRRSPGYEEVIHDSSAESRMTISPDGEHVAYRIRDGVWNRVVRDLKPGGQFTSVSDLMFDRTSRNLYYLAQQGNGWILVSNDVAGKPCDSISDLLLAPRSGQPLYIAYRKGRQSLESGPQLPALNTQHPTPSFHSGRPWRLIAEVVFTPGDSQPAYLASDSGVWHVVEDTTVRLSLPVLALHSLAYKSDTREPVYVAVDGLFSAQLMVGTHPFSTRHGSIDEVSVSPDGKRIAYVTLDSSGRSMFMNLSPVQGSGRLVSPLRFSPDSRHFLYVAANDQTRGLHVSLDGHESPAYNEVRDIQFDTATSRLAYTARSGDSYFAVVDTTPGPPHDGIGYLGFVPGTGEAAYLAVKGDSAAQVIAGHGGKYYEDVGGLQFAPDHKRAAYGAKQGNTFYWICTEVRKQ